jgi:uncharacterized membrane protein YtjA (UPF0391 family)
VTDFKLKLGIGIPARGADCGVLGFAGVAVAAAGIAKLLFVVFLVRFLISLVAPWEGQGEGH